jgi:hypothetical protein
METGLAGWGGRIRTSEWRNQNPLPYHLATPQYASDDRLPLAAGRRNIARRPPWINVRLGRPTPYTCPAP